MGISFGIDRIYDVIYQNELHSPKFLSNTSYIMFVNWGGDELKHSLKLLKFVREIGISSEIYPDSAKIKKQYSYADAKRIQLVISLGVTELQQDIFKIKDLLDNREFEFPMSEFHLLFLD